MPNPASAPELPASPAAPAAAPDPPPPGDSAGDQAPRVVVSADDYGYFDCVSRGILDAARSGVVRATSVLVTSPRLDEQVQWLRDAAGLEIGVHLTLTFGEPLTPGLRRVLGSRRPGVLRIARAVLTGALPAAVVREEWREQTGLLADLGLAPSFLNSHEHVHALPPLRPVVAEVAREFGIRHVRRVRASVRPPLRPRAVLRHAVFRALDLGAAPDRGPRLLGLHESGRLCRDAVRRMFASLAPGTDHELMCHPGRFDPAEVVDERLRAYHDWEGELRLLTDATIPEIARAAGVRLVGFRDLADRSATPSARLPAPQTSSNASVLAPAAGRLALGASGGPQ